MLKFFRDQKDSWLVKGILILTALSFMSLFGIQGMSEMRIRNRPVATLKGKSLTIQDFLNEYNRNIEMLRRLSNGEFSTAAANESGLPMRTLTEMASRAVLERVVDTMRLTVSEDDVRENVRNMAAFSGYDGEFDMGVFKEYLQNTGKTENQFISEMFLQMKSDQLLEAVKASAVVPQDIAKMMYRLYGDTRVADVFTVNPADIKITKKPTAEELQSTYEGMTDDLIAPEYRSISVMALTVDDVAAKIKITDDELREAFAENKDAYTIEEIRDVDQMLFVSEDEAKEADKALKSGKSFEQVAKDIAKQTPEQTHLGDITPSTATGDWSDAVFAAKKGAIVGPVQTSFGWQILRVNKITPKIEKSFADVKGDLESKMKAALAFDTMAERSVALDDRLGAGESLEDVAASEGLAVKKVLHVDSTGTDANGKAVDLPKNVLAIAFMSDKGQVSPMIEEGDAYYVVRVDAVIEPAVKSLETAKAEVVAAWTADAQKAAARKLAQTVKERLEKGEKAALVAKTKNVSYERRTDVSRFDNKLPQIIRYALFTQPVGAVSSTPADGKYIVAKSIKAVPVNPETDLKGVEKTRRLLTKETADERANAVLAAFGEDFKLTLKEDAVKEAFSMVTKTSSVEEDY